jgi:uncharacterized protein (DUF58 family)
MKIRKELLSDDFLAQLSQLKILQKKKSSPSEMGSMHSFHSGGHADFLEHRAYQKGDEPRFIDWNVYNRLQQLTVKVFSKQEASDNFILLDASASMEFTAGSKGLKICEIAAAISFLSLTANDAVQLFWHNFSYHKIPKAKGQKAIIPILKNLSEIEYGGVANLSKALLEITQKNKSGNIFILSDFYEHEELLKTINLMNNGRFTITLFQVLSLEEINFPASGFFTFQDSETVEQTKIKVNNVMTRLYAEQITQFTEELKNKATSLHCKFYQLNADAPFSETVHSLRQHLFFR